MCTFVWGLSVQHSNSLNSGKFGYYQKLVSYEKWNSCFIPTLPGCTFISSRRSQKIPSEARRRNSSFKSLSRGYCKEPAIKTKQHQTHHKSIHVSCDAENGREIRGGICVNMILNKYLNGWIIFPFLNQFLPFCSFISWKVTMQQGWEKLKDWGKKNREKENDQEVLVISLHSKLYSNFAFISFTKGSLQFQRKMAQH